MEQSLESFGPQEAAEFVRNIADFGIVSQKNEPSIKIQTYRSIQSETTASPDTTTLRSIQLAEAIENTWGIWGQYCNECTAAPNGFRIGELVYNAIPTLRVDDKVDEQFNVRQYFLVTVSKRLAMIHNASIEGRFIQGLLAGFQGRSTTQNNGTNQGFVSLLLQPSHIQHYFRELISARNTRDKQNIENVLAMEKEWIDMAVDEPDSIAGGKYFAKLMYAGASAPEKCFPEMMFKAPERCFSKGMSEGASIPKLPDVSADRQYLIESCFPKKFKACKESGMKRHSDPQQPWKAQRVKVFFEAALNTFQELARSG